MGWCMILIFQFECDESCCGEESNSVQAVHRGVKEVTTKHELKKKNFLQDVKGLLTERYFIRTA